MALYSLTSVQSDDNTPNTELSTTPRPDVALLSTQPQDAAPPPDAENALLPARMANLVSFATRSTGLAVRIGSAIGGYSLDVAKHTTLSTLQLGRTVVEGVLTGARKDTVARSASRRSDLEAAAEVGRSINMLHLGMDQIIFWAATGFNFSSAALSMFSETTQILLSTVDQFFGSTESSRAIASIIAMVRREFSKPAGGQGEAVTVGELVTAFCALAFLQRSCRALLLEERRRLAVDEIVWDVVVLNSGMRVDVHEVSRHQQFATHIHTDDLSVDPVGHWTTRALPNNAKVSINHEIVTSETISVDVVSDVDVGRLRLQSPPGLELVEENRITRQPRPGQQGTGAATRFVYRREDRQERRMSFEKTDGHIIPGNVEIIDGESETPLADTDSDSADRRLCDIEQDTDQSEYQTPRLSLESPSSSDLTEGSSTQGPSEVAEWVRVSRPGSPPSMPSEKQLPSIPVPMQRDENTTCSAEPGRKSGIRGMLERSMSLIGIRKGNTKELQMTPIHNTSRNDYLSIHETVQESTTSLAETYSFFPSDTRRAASMSNINEVNSDAENVGAESSHAPDVQSLSLRPTLSRAASSYRLSTRRSQTSLVSYVRPAPNLAENLSALRRDGSMPGMFPERHTLANAARYMRFASASYGSSFLKIMGIATNIPKPVGSDDTHHELAAFAHHTRSSPSDILLSSFVDPQGGSDATGRTNTGVPLVHYVSLDHESKAVVLACRGTLGFEDVLTDMTCEYDDLVWRGETYKVHKGVHASARRLLYGGDGRILYTIKEALEKYPTYGLVLTGHSLGAAVTSLLAIMLSEPGRGTGTPFVTSSSPHTHLLTHPSSTPATNNPPPTHITLPPNRAIHVYAYGPPATVSPTLRLATRGLITTIVNGNDLVPHLSLGLLHDFQAAALSLKTEHADTKTELLRRLWQTLSSAPRNWGRSSLFPPPSSRIIDDGDEQDGDAKWAYSTLNLLRKSMTAGEKLVPPGEVFVVESTPVLRREAFVLRRGRGASASASTGPGGGGPDGGVGGNAARWAWEEEENHFGRPAKRMVFKYVRDVERRFGEVRFGRGMLTDHSPGRYEAALERLVAGVGVRG